ncbi:unnamed protein product [Phytomonas sp. EM1]|nr:unnamed protein product [Phytomonas sp. EM1]|eukprot:CCW61190.1 unnamed protein product [Phytomonas sp. isolate EM1]
MCVGKHKRAIRDPQKHIMKAQRRGVSVLICFIPCTAMQNHLNYVLLPHYPPKRLPFSNGQRENASAASGTEEKGEKLSYGLQRFTQVANLAHLIT